MLCVLQVTPALDAGGVERTTLEVTEAIVRAGGRALVASAGGRLEPELAAVGGELIRLPLKTKNPLAVRANADRLAEIARREAVAIIHARSRAPGWSAFWAARKLGLPFVTTYHGVYNARTPLKRLYNSVMARGDVVIANSEFTRAHVLAEHRIDPAKIVTIPRGVDVAAFDPAAIAPERIAAVRASLGLAPGDARPLIAAPARLTRWKGQLVMIEAARHLAAEGGPPFVLALPGDPQGRDDYLAEVRAAAQAAGLAQGVLIPGHVADMPALFAATAVAVFPSLEPEAFGRGAIEAQAMAVPVVAAGHGGLAETVIDGRTGALVPPGDAPALARAIQRLLAMTAQERARIGAAGRAHVLERYSTKRLQESTLAVYGRLLTEMSA